MYTASSCQTFIDGGQCTGIMISRIKTTIIKYDYVLCTNSSAMKKLGMDLFYSEHQSELLGVVRKNFQNPEQYFL